MALVISFEDRVDIPMTIETLAEFRRWSQSASFPRQGRIDYCGGRIEVDMSPEDFFCHGTLKTELVSAMHQWIKAKRAGHLVTDSTRVSSVEGDFSTEPDIVFVSHAAMAEGRVRLVPKASGEPGRYVEVEGAPDLIVEIVSDVSRRKDTERLPATYFRAGVREYWLADALGEEMVFRVLERGGAAFEPAATDDRGRPRSTALSARVRLDRRRSPQGHWEFDAELD